MNDPTGTISPSTIVSTDLVDKPTAVGSALAGNRVILIPMAEWQQCAMRGARTFVQLFAFLVGGGTIAGYATGLGIPPASFVNLPSTGIPLADAALYSLVFAVCVALWNMLEFALDMDLWAPKFRA